MNSRTGSVELDTLVSLIVDSVNTFKAEYEKSKVPVPSLSNPSCLEHDTMKESGSERLRTATRIIEAACAQLTAIVVRPELTLINNSGKHAICACLQVASSRDVASILHDAPEGQHISSLSKATGVDAGRLSRILRLLATNHIFQEVAPDMFANNMVSVKLASSMHTKENVESRTRETFRAATFISEFLKQREITSRLTSPFEMAYGLPLMDYHNTPEGKKTVAKFMAGVTGWGEIAVSSDISRSTFPWEKYLSKAGGTVICDVGAGEGRVMLKLALTYAGHPFRVILQDRLAVVELCKQVWKDNFPGAVNEGRVDFVPIDFFKESPVPGCDVYYIRHCIHNWSDEKCITILKNIVAAMRSNADSILLIHEIVLRPVVGQSFADIPGVLSESGLPPSPLLKNFGVARSLEYGQDINMMGLLDAKERTLDEYIALGTKAGLGFDQLWILEGSSMMQFRLVH